MSTVRRFCGVSQRQPNNQGTIDRFLWKGIGLFYVGWMAPLQIVQAVRSYLVFRRFCNQIASHRHNVPVARTILPSWDKSSALVFSQTGHKKGNAYIHIISRHATISLKKFLLVKVVAKLCVFLKPNCVSRSLIPCCWA